MKKDLQYGQRTIRRLLDELQQPVALENLYAEAILAQALRNAAGRPTPQALMAARNMTVREATIFPRAAGASSEVAIGSEFGSSAYPQFHKPPTKRGYWLYPAATDTAVLAQVDEGLEQVLQDVIRG